MLAKTQIMVHMRPLLENKKRLTQTIAGSLKRIHSNVKITASPRVALCDVVPRIRVEGLAPKTAVTLGAEMFDDKGKQLLSNSHYISTEVGTVDVTTSSSIGGSYEGVFPTGLISTLRSMDDSFKYSRVVHDTVEKPLQIKITLYEGHQPMHTTAALLDHLTLERHFVTPGVKRTEVRSGRVRGALFMPAGEGYFPGVVEMYGATGILVEKRAALMASRGIACLCLPYFNYDDIPSSKLENLDVEYFEEATEFLTSQPKVIPDRCGVLSNCFGGIIGHTMAINIDKVKALFAINFGLRNLGVFTHRGDSLYYNDEKVQSKADVKQIVKYLDNSNVLRVPTDQFMEYLTTSEGSFVDQLPKVSSEKYFSYAYGDDDTFPFKNCVPAIKKAVGKDFETNFKVKIYPGAGHIVDQPYSPTINSSLMRIYGAHETDEYVNIIQYWGGKNKEIVSMQEEVWSDLQQFFKYHIKECSPWYQQNLSEFEKSLLESSIKGKL